MIKMNVSVKSVLNMVTAFCCSLVLSSCVATQNNGPQTHHLLMQSDEALLVTLQLPVGWQIQPETTKKQFISLLGGSRGEQANITANKLEVDQVSLKLLKAFGRINIKGQVHDGWLEQRYRDDIDFDGNHAIQYVLRKGDDAAIVYFVEKGQYVYIITLNAPAARIAAINDGLTGNIKLGNQNNMGGENPQPVQKQSYIASPDIFNLQVSQFDYAQDTYKKDLSKALSLHERIALLEQVSVKYTLFKSESLLHSKDEFADRIFYDIEQLHSENQELQGLARCDALISYLNNRLTQAITKLETILKKDPGDMHAKLYLTMIRPYDTAFIGKTIQEALERQPDNILALYIQSRHYFAEGRKRESFDLLKETLKRYPKNIWLKFAVAKNFQNEGSRSKARQLYAEVLQLYPPFIPARYNLAFSLYKEKKYTEAQKHLQKIVNVHHDDPDAILLQGLLYKNTGKHEAAKHSFETALAIEPNNYRALYNMGALCATKLSDKSCARQAFTRYIAVAPQDNRHASIISWLNKN